MFFWDAVLIIVGLYVGVFMLVLACEFFITKPHKRYSEQDALIETLREEFNKKR